MTRDALVPAVGERPRIEAPRRDREPHVVAIEHGQQTRPMVEMRVRERDEIDPSRPRRQARAQLGEQPSRLGPTVNEREVAVELQQKCVTLPDVERPHADRRRSAGRDHDRR